RDTSEWERSAAMGFLDGSEALAMGVGALASGALADRFGFTAVFTSFAAGALVIALLTARFSRAARRQAAAGPGPARGGAPSGPAPRPPAVPAPRGGRGSPAP